MAVPAAPRATKYEIVSPSSHLVTLAHQRPLRLRLPSIKRYFSASKPRTP